MLVKYFSLVEYFFFTNTLEMAVSGNLEAQKLKFDPPNIRNVPTPRFPNTSSVPAGGLITVLYCKMQIRL